MRADKAPWCNDTEDSMAMGLFTAGCGYIEGADWYRGSARIPETLIKHLLPEIMTCLREPLRDEDVQRFFGRLGKVWEP